MDTTDVKRLAKLMGYEHVPPDAEGNCHAVAHQRSPLVAATPEQLWRAWVQLSGFRRSAAIQSSVAVSTVFLLGAAHERERKKAECQS